MEEHLQDDIVKVAIIHCSKTIFMGLSPGNIVSVLDAQSQTFFYAALYHHFNYHRVKNGIQAFDNNDY